MKMRKLAGAALVCFLLCLVFAVFAETADAQESVAKGADKSIATKQGVGGSLGTKEIDAEKLPGKIEIGIAVGSFMVMIAVVKWL